jgi:IMP dehydrogenase / GMP reductase domain
MVFPINETQNDLSVTREARHDSGDARRRQCPFYLPLACGSRRATTVGRGQTSAAATARETGSATIAAARPQRRRKKQMAFEEGVDSYMPCAGKLKDNLETTLAKIRSTMCNCRAKTLREFHQRAGLTIASSVSLREGGAHDVTVRDVHGDPDVGYE